MNDLSAALPAAVAAQGPSLVRMPAHQPQQAQVWLIEQGTIDVFLAPASNGQVAGARVHWFTANAGDLLPLPGLDYGLGYLLLTSPSAQARYRILTRAEFERDWECMAGRQDLTRSIDGLLGSLSALASLSPPKGSLALVDGTSTASGDAASACFPKDAGLWFMVHGGASFMGDIPLDGHAGCTLPMPANAWLTLAVGSAVTAVSTAALPGGGGAVMDGLYQMILLMLAYAVERHRLLEQTELGRLRSRQQIEQQALSGALGGFVGLLGARDSGPPSLPKANRLLAACRLIGGTMQITFRSHVLEQDATGTDALKEITEASGVRSRAVALKGVWWRENYGPLLAFGLASDAAYALLPNKSKGYDAVDPLTGERIAVDAAFAAGLAPFGHMFFRGFPRKSLGLGDIVRFAAFGIRGDIATVMLVGLAGGLLGMAIPIASGHLFDTVFPAADRLQLIQVVLVLFVAGFAALLFEATRSFAMLSVEAKAGGDLQAAVWDHLLGLPVPFFRNKSAGDMAMRINGINEIRKALSGTFITTILSSLFSAFNALLLFFYSAKLALVASILVALALAFNLFIGYLSIRIKREAGELEGKVSGIVFEYLSGIAKLRVTGTEARAFTNWALLFGDQKRLNLRAGALTNMSAVFSAIFPVVANAAIFLLIAMVLYSEHTAGFSTGSFIAFSAAFTTFLSATLALVRSGFELLDVVPTYERTKPILEAVPEVDQNKNHPGTLNGAIELSNVSFAYDPSGPLILDNVSLSIAPGEFVALVGSSGSGKSTLLRLMLGFEQPRQGAIYYDGHDIADTDIGAVRRQLGVVLQSGRLVGGDIYKNIVGSTGRLLSDAWEAARACGLDEDIAAMPMGMHTMVNGGTISGGQRQRILIARAIVNKPRIIYFDEATSALDNRTQATVSSSIERLRATRVVIAHRLSTIMNADRIYVLDKGKLLESGTYAELMAMNGLFSELAKRQLA